MDELKPCPFCGCQTIERTEEHYDTLPGTFFAMKCANCPALMELSDRDHVADRWNRRAEDPEMARLKQEVDRLAEALALKDEAIREFISECQSKTTICWSCERGKAALGAK